MTCDPLNDSTILWLGAVGNIDIREKIKVLIPLCCLSDVRVFWNKIALVSRAFPCVLGEENDDDECGYH
jgi:hypothetical protein